MEKASKEILVEGSANKNIPEYECSKLRETLEIDFRYFLKLSIIYNEVI